MHEGEESTWIRQAQQGDRNAFAELVKRYWARIHRWLRGVTGCAHGADDLTQDVFLKAWQALPAYKDGYFRAWLYRIARNVWIDSRRTSAAKIVEALPESAAAKDPEPIEELMTREHEASVKQACESLPGSVRSAFLLWVQEEMPYAEIAEALDITEATARWRVYRARRLLMRILSSHRDRGKP